MIAPFACSSSATAWSRATIVPKPLQFGSSALESSKGERRLSALQSAGRLLYCGLERAFFDTVKGLSFLDELTFLAGILLPAP
jgi:hypothetical protein